MKRRLTGDVIEAFAGMFLSRRYDEAVATPQFHRDVWALYCSDAPQIACAAPRDHAKSTALTFDFSLAGLLFRDWDYEILVGASEELASEQLSNISGELHENEDLQKEFGSFKFLSDTKSDIIVEMKDGHQFRILARGASQKIRGRLWKGKRPNMLLFDDIEDDEQVLNPEVRLNFRKWFFRAAKQALSVTGRCRIHGTILHEDSLLSRLMVNKTWKSVLYRAHRGYDDFTEILWPDKWSEERLRARRAEFEADGDGPGYAQEFLNNPLDHADAYLQAHNFIPMGEFDYKAPKKIRIGVDLAISVKDHANRTSFSVAGKCPRNLVHFIDQRVGRMGTDAIIDTFFELDKEWNPEAFIVEDGNIWKAIAPTIEREMQIRDHYLNIEAASPIGDKAAKGRALQKRHKNAGTRWDAKAPWYEGMRMELLRFTGVARAALDDQFDSAAIVVRNFDMVPEPEDEDFEDHSEEEMFMKATQNLGRSAVTGY